MKLINKDVHEHYCSLEMLQLLYDKGMRYREWTDGAFHRNSLAEKRFNEGDVSYLKDTVTHQIVVEWLRVNHGIWISASTVMKVEPDLIKVKKGTFSFSYHICWATEKQFTVNYNKPVIWGDGFITPQEAIEAGILYVLNNLI